MVGLTQLIVVAGAYAADAPGLVWNGERPRPRSEAVLLLHDEAGSPSDFGSLGPRLAASRRLVYAPELPNDADVSTVRSAMDWLARRGASTVHVLGVGRGANLGLHAAAAIPAIVDVALVSPLPQAPGLHLSAAIDRYDDRPLLVVAAQSDALSARAAAFVHDRVRGPRHLELLPRSGDRLLTTAPALEPLLVSWCNGNLLRTPSPSDPPTQVRTSHTNDLETRGVRLDERGR